MSGHLPSMLIFNGRIKRIMRVHVSQFDPATAPVRSIYERPCVPCSNRAHSPPKPPTHTCARYFDRPCALCSSMSSMMHMAMRRSSSGRALSSRGAMLGIRPSTYGSAASPNDLRKLPRQLPTCRVDWWVGGGRTGWSLLRSGAFGRHVHSICLSVEAVAVVAYVGGTDT